MQIIYFFLANALFVFVVFCKNVHHRNPRYIWGTYTTTVIEKRIATSIVPSSCLHVDATLPPCRSVRLLKFPKFISNQLQSGNDSNAEKKSDVATQTELGWAEYIGLRAPTVTVTHFDITTTVVQDPRVVVTFAMKGCKPKELPKDLNRCIAETPTLTIQNMVPTSTIEPINASPTQQKLENTKVTDNEDAAVFPFGTINEIQGNTQSLEGTPEVKEDFDSAKATDPLSF